MSITGKMVGNRIVKRESIFGKIRYVSYEIDLQLYAYPFYFIWSFGIVLYEMFSLGDEPYSTMNIRQLKTFLGDGQRLSKPAYADDIMYVWLLW